MNNQLIEFNPVEKASLYLMREDLRYVYTLHVNLEQIKPNYYVSSLPYLGLILDGVEEWIKRYFNRYFGHYNSFVLNDEEKQYISKVRSSIKFWNNSFASIYNELEKSYVESYNYFTSLSNPVYRLFKLYTIFGVDYANNSPIGNTLINKCFIPDFSFGGNNAYLINKIGTALGNYTNLFIADKSFTVDKQILFVSKDYGGIFKHPIGNEFNNRFVLFSLLCQLQFITIGIDRYIMKFHSTQLRFSYILYYYVCKILPEINVNLNTDFKIDKSFYSDKYRNAMAHYGLGVELEEEDLNSSDHFWGLTQKYFQCSSLELYEIIIDCINKLAGEITLFLGLNMN